MASITKAVITAGGYATRFLPITKAVPKEMLPLGDKPVIHYILQELKDAGITDVLLLIGRGRESLMNYLDKNYEVDDYLERRIGQTADAKPISKTTNFFQDLNLYFRRVPLPRGVADCVKYASSFVGDESTEEATTENTLTLPVAILSQPHGNTGDPMIFAHDASHIRLYTTDGKLNYIRFK